MLRDINKKKILNNLFNIVFSKGDDGIGIVVCKFTCVELVTNYLAQLKHWRWVAFTHDSYYKLSDGTSQEVIYVLSEDVFKENCEDWLNEDAIALIII